jgi:hypothetical protein
VIISLGVNDCGPEKMPNDPWAYGWRPYGFRLQTNAIASVVALMFKSPLPPLIVGPWVVTEDGSPDP